MSQQNDKPNSLYPMSTSTFQHPQSSAYIDTLIMSKAPAQQLENLSPQLKRQFGAYIQIIQKRERLQETSLLKQTILADQIRPKKMLKITLKILLFLICGIYFMNVILPNPIRYEYGHIRKDADGKQCTPQTCQGYSQYTQQFQVKHMSPLNRKLRIYLQLDQTEIQRGQSDKLYNSIKNQTLTEQIERVEIFTAKTDTQGVVTQGTKMSSLEGKQVMEEIVEGNSMYYAGSVHVIDSPSFMIRVIKKKSEMQEKEEKQKKAQAEQAAKQQKRRKQQQQVKKRQQAEKDRRQKQEKIQKEKQREKQLEKEKEQEKERQKQKEKKQVQEQEKKQEFEKQQLQKQQFQEKKAEQQTQTKQESQARKTKQQLQYQQWLKAKPKFDPTTGQNANSPYQGNSPLVTIPSENEAARNNENTQNSQNLDRKAQNSPNNPNANPIRNLQQQKDHQQQQLTKQKQFNGQQSHNQLQINQQLPDNTATITTPMQQSKEAGGELQSKSQPQTEKKYAQIKPDLNPEIQQPQKNPQTQIEPQLQPQPQKKPTTQSQTQKQSEPEPEPEPEPQPQHKPEPKHVPSKKNFPLIITVLAHSLSYTLTQLLIRFISLIIVIFVISETPHTPRLLHLIMITYCNPLIFLDVAFPNVVFSLITSICGSSYVGYLLIFIYYTHERSKNSFWHYLTLAIKLTTVLLIFVVNVLRLEHVKEYFQVYTIETGLLIFIMFVLGTYVWDMIIYYEQQLYRDMLNVTITIWYLVVLFASNYAIEYGFQDVIVYIILQTYSINLAYLVNKYDISNKSWDDLVPNQSSDSKQINGNKTTLKKSSPLSLSPTKEPSLSQQISNKSIDSMEQITTADEKIFDSDRSVKNVDKQMLLNDPNSQDRVNKKRRKRKIEKSKNYKELNVKQEKMSPKQINTVNANDSRNSGKEKSKKNTQQRPIKYVNLASNQLHFY